ncbi:MAG: gamma carbonic anhydrase family protein [Spirochaetia bacterium]|mgnify:CR=1 FL=1|jgi:carbonic anhydrase/acetyltransferase-like protein (isoleucine patch superfamily)|nr:gamma carbonic anhydrase family protein [Spirochaetia bacterium]NLK04888.1 gamma carbonic anhydrase family protein [Spirochaetales bacterium]
MLYTHNTHKPLVGKDCYIAPSADLIGNVTLKDGCSVWFHATLRADVGSIEIGEQTNIQDNAVLHVTKDQNLVVGARCTVGHSAILHACTIANECLIGMGAIVLDGSYIGEQSLVGAGSVVSPNKSFPPRSLLMGVPAKLVRTLTDEEYEKIRENTEEYAHYAQDLANGSQAIG